MNNEPRCRSKEGLRASEMRRFEFHRLGFVERVSPWRRPRPILYFPTLGIPLFWFCYLVYEVLRIAIGLGIVFPPDPNRGLPIVLAEQTIRAVDLLRLEKGVPLERPNGPPLVDPVSDPFFVVVVGRDGQVRWKGSELDMNEPVPWAADLTASEIARTVVFLRPLPGASYGQVVKALDWLFSQDDNYQIPIRSIELVRCEETPTRWELWDDLPPNEPLSRKITPIEPPSIPSFQISNFPSPPQIVD